MNSALQKIKSLFRQRGGATAEFLFAAPALLLLGMSGLQALFFYDAKNTLTYATFEAAREGAVTHAQTGNMRRELGVRLSPIFGGDGSASEAIESMAEAMIEVNNPLFTKIKVLNPTKEAFDDFGVKNNDNNKTEIPNDNLKFRSRQVGSTSGVNIQDANILKVKVTYGYKLEVPIINAILPSVLKWTDPGNIVYYAAGRIPVTAVATVRMQSPAWPDNNESTSGGGSPGGTPPDSTDPGESQPPGGDDTGSGDDDSDSGSGNENSDGDDSGDENSDGDDSGDGNSDSGDGNNLDDSDGGDTNAGGDDTTSGDADELKCEQKTLEEDTEGADSEDASMWDDLWGTISGGVTYAYDFLKGFWEGIKGQAADIASMVLHPIDTANGLIELGKAFYNDFEGTATAIAQALGTDLQTLVQCGAYDKGRIIGSYASPAFMLKLATKLAKFGKLAKALDETKKDFGCASFTGETSVLTSNGVVSIDAITLNSKVLSRDEESFIDADQAVIKLFERTAPEYFELTTEYERLRVTGEHPVWKQGEGWVEVKDLSVDDIVASADGDILILNNQRIEKPIKVYNFSVDRNHNYFVGKSRMWVHNSVCELEFIGGVRYTSVKIDSIDGKNKALNKPQALTVYRVNGRHTYRTDEKGRVVEATSTIKLEDLDTTSRNYYQQCKIGKCGIDGDEGGHLIATKLGGPGEAINLVPQNMNLNRGKWRTMERDWGIAASEGKTVEVTINPIYSEGSVRPNRPDSFEVVYAIDDGPPITETFINQPGG